MKSMASGEAEGKMFLSFFCLVGGSCSSMVAAKGEFIESMSSGVGLPVISRTLSSWFRVEVPGKKGFPMSNSARIHPTLHMSTPFEYLLDPSNISGALYHLVAT